MSSTAGAVEHFDIAVVGAGAAGLFASLAARGALSSDGTAGPVAQDAPSVVMLDGQQAPGRKILISGGGRCNVTNATVTSDDFLSDDPKLVRNALREFGPTQVQAFFAARGVALHTESLGKVFPDSDRAHDILDALLSAAEEAGVHTRFGRGVERMEAIGVGWDLGLVTATRVVLATGGLSVPATGSTGFGLALAEGLGHDLAPRVPALAALHGRIGSTELAGITVPAIVTVADADGGVLARSAGSLLFTHKGVTGPAALDVSHAVELAAERGDTVHTTIDLWTLADPDGPLGPHLGDPKLPGCCLATPPSPTTPDALDRHLQALTEADPRTPFGALLSPRLPRRLVAALLGVTATVPAGQVRREDRREAARTLTQLDAGITETAGFQKAEVTTGGVRLRELDRRTLESRLAPGLHACGEVCDVTGRLGGFNFQWAWTSGWLAGRGAATALS